MTTIEMVFGALGLGLGIGGGKPLVEATVAGVRRLFGKRPPRGRDAASIAAARQMLRERDSYVLSMAGHDVAPTLRAGLVKQPSRAGQSFDGEDLDGDLPMPPE